MYHRYQEICQNLKILVRFVLSQKVTSFAVNLISSQVKSSKLIVVNSKQRY